MNTDTMTMEDQQRRWWIDTSRVVASLLDAHPDLVPPYRLNRYDRTVEWYCHTAEDTRTALRVLGGGEKVESAGNPAVRGETYGFAWEVSRLGLACEYVETGEVEEVEELEVVEPAKTRTRTVQRPVLEKVCPPILSDDEDRESAQAVAS